MHALYGKPRDKLSVLKLSLISGEKEKEHGLSYTVFSRVTRPSDLGLLGGLSRDRLLRKISTQSKMKPRIKEERRIDKLVRHTIAF